MLNSLVTVSSFVNGVQSSSAIAAGANGYYYLMMPSGTFSGTNQVLTYIVNNSLRDPECALPMIISRTSPPAR